MQKLRGKDQQDKDGEAESKGTRERKTEEWGYGKEKGVLFTYTGLIPETDLYMRT